MERIAIVLDTSGSIDGMVHLFEASEEVRILHPQFGGGMTVDPEKVNSLLNDYKEVYFVTDGYIYGKLDKRVHIIKTPHYLNTNSLRYRIECKLRQIKVRYVIWQAKTKRLKK